MSTGGLETKSEQLLCSAKGCRATAAFELRWNNPKIHTPDRRKVWLACGDHREQLSSFLDLRGFLRDVAPVAPVASGELPDA